LKLLILMMLGRPIEMRRSCMLFEMQLCSRTQMALQRLRRSQIAINQYQPVCCGIHYRPLINLPLHHIRLPDVNLIVSVDAPHFLLILKFFELF
jgi:hypothetical protein